MAFTLQLLGPLLQFDEPDRVMHNKITFALL